MSITGDSVIPASIALINAIMVNNALIVIAITIIANPCLSTYDSCVVM